MKQLWRDIRAVLRVAAVQVVVRIITVVMAVVGVGESVVPGELLPELAHAVAGKP